MIANYKRRGRGPSLARVAHHEAGHAVIAEALGARVYLATVVPTPGRRACVEHGATDGETEILILYAGPLAAARRAGRSIRWSRGGRARPQPAAVRFYGGSRDLATAAQVADLGTPGTDAVERRAYLRWLWEQARLLVERHWPEIEAVAATLVERGTMTGEEVREVAAGIRRALKLSGANGYPMQKKAPGDGIRRGPGCGGRGERPRHRQYDAGRSGAHA